MGLLETKPYAVDDSLQARTRQDGKAGVAVYPWSEVAVVIGRGGKQELELNAAAISADQIPLLKRAGGGCAVVLDPGNVIVSVALPLPGLAGIKSAFARITTWLAAQLASLEIEGVVQSGVSDLAIGDRKIGGSCVYRTRDLLYYSTTLLVNPDLDLVDRYLPHPPREPDYRDGRTHHQFMGRLVDLGYQDSPRKLANKLGPALKETLPELNKSLISP